VVREASGGGSRHAPFEAGACTFCHDPHGGARRGNLRQEPALLCLSCHAELQARIRHPSAVLHPPVKAGACLECHRAHGSASPALLVAEPPRLCGACHHASGEEMVRAHQGIAAAGGRCTGCHDPHVVR
jgi:predicted CXXCH cytochrome family protein